MADLFDKLTQIAYNSSMKIKNNIKSNKDLKVNRPKTLKNLVKMKLKWEVIGLSNSINKNYHNWLGCVTTTSEYVKESDLFGHGFGVFPGSKYFRIEASTKSGCNGIIDQKNCTLYSGTAHKEKHVWGFVVKKNFENHKIGDILTRNYEKVGNVLNGNTANLGQPNSHYPNYTDCWAGADIW